MKFRHWRHIQIYTPREKKLKFEKRLIVTCLNESLIKTRGINILAVQFSQPIPLIQIEWKDKKL